ncbi:alpha-amylase family glycosyl hydrolase [Flavobacterium sp.]|uniref:alpha-amylase family glycosyl hydrolase n=1 Tax=Flavobacterium sp. TaxID=239 RepID=UPI003528BC95
MKKFLLLLLTLPICTFAQQQTVTYSISPSPTFEGTDALTITVNGSSINEATWGVSNNQLYAWVWALNSSNANIPYGGNGAWENSDNSKLMTYNSINDTYSFTYNPSVFSFFGSSEVAKVGFLIKAKNGTGDKKSQDILLNVGSFQVTLMNNIVAGGIQLFTTSYTVAARHTVGPSNYVLKRNGVVVNTQNNLPASTGAPSYTYSDATAENINSYVLEVTQNGSTKSFQFSAIKTLTPVSEALPSNLQDGINYNTSDLTKATLVLSAPNKDFVYVAGSFNNWSPTPAYSMKKDPSTGKFWLELNGLNPGTMYAYQYWVCDNTAVPANSPRIVKTADMYSTLVLSPFDDGEIIALGKFPNLPDYNTIAPNQQREVTVLQTGQTPYNWSDATLNFVKPNKDNLVVYEVLVRDFDANRSYQDLINKIDYFKDLGVNAIQLMPVMEFEGNESWGYNTAFHLAIDKYYGTPDKLKEFIDICHQNGIAVILDVALNHSFGRNPGVRMWMNDHDGDGWGSPTTENPYYNTTARHSYSVGEDFNHQSALTQYYTRRVIKQWIEEFKIDGFRWDLTKGFTQNCSGGDEACTNTYQADRVQVLKDYADYSWILDPDHIVIFEHLGSNNEEQQWANHRLGEGKGVLMWGEMYSQYKELAMGYAGQNINNMGHISRGFAGKRLIGYPESHDKDRMMYEAITYGSNSGSAPVNGNLTNALSRMGAIGATSILVPGPKMIWHFGELGNNQSIYTCSNGTVNDEGSTPPGDCKLDTKPQWQWTENWLSDSRRNAIYDAWSRMIKLKINEPVFNGEYSISPNGSNLRQRIYVYDNSLPTSQLKNVVILANFSTSNENITPDFPYTGTWYNLMNDTSFSVTNTTTAINLQPGEFRVYGNQPSTLSTNNFEINTNIVLAPNPAYNTFTISVATTKVDIYSVTGQLVKSFNNEFNSDYSFDVSDLNKGIYFVNATDVNGSEKTMKLIKN